MRKEDKSSSPVVRPLQARKGNDSCKPGQDHKTYGISVLTQGWGDKQVWHSNKIEVFGDETLRDDIVALLNNRHAK